MTKEISFRLLLLKFQIFSVTSLLLPFMVYFIRVSTHLKKRGKELFVSIVNQGGNTTLIKKAAARNPEESFTSDVMLMVIDIFLHIFYTYIFILIVTLIRPYCIISLSVIR